jgi:autotransporter adhesin
MKPDGTLTESFYIGARTSAGGSWIQGDVDGNMTFNAKKSLNFNNNSNFNAETAFSGKMYIDGGASFRSRASFSSEADFYEKVTFEGNVIMKSRTDFEGATTFGTAPTFKEGASFGNKRITDIAPAEEDNDAVNLGQLKKIGLVRGTSEFLVPVVYDYSNPAKITLSGPSQGVTLANVASGLISQDSKEAINGGQFFALQGRVETLEGQVGNGGGGNGNGGGGNDDHHGAGTGSLDIGKGNTVTAENGIGHGNDTKVTGSNGIGVGTGTQVSGRHGIAMGTSAQASGNSSVAIGQGARATANDAVALGNGSVADRNNTVSVGAAGRERQITNVAAATQRTDAANWGQVQDAVGQVRGAMDGLRDWAKRRFDKLDSRIDGMAAVSAANAQMAINAGGVEPGKGRFAVGVGLASGERALAVGYAKAITERVRFSVGGSTGSSQTSAGIGIGIDL